MTKKMVSLSEIHCGLCVFFEFFVVRLREKRLERESYVLSKAQSLLKCCANVTRVPAWQYSAAKASGDGGRKVRG